MTTCREDVRDAIKLALEDIDTSHTYEINGAAKYYRSTVTTVKYMLDTPDQVDDVDRPFIGFRQNADATPDYYPGYMVRETTPWTVFCYANIDGDDAERLTQANAMMADVQGALLKDIRLGGEICFLTIRGLNTTEGSLAERGFVSVGLDTVSHHRTDEV